MYLAIALLYNVHARYHPFECSPVRQDRCTRPHRRNMGQLTKLVVCSEGGQSYKLTCRLLGDTQAHKYRPLKTRVAYRAACEESMVWEGGRDRGGNSEQKAVYTLVWWMTASFRHSVTSFKDLRLGYRSAAIPRTLARLIWPRCFSLENVKCEGRHQKPF